jgi:hypothetical protein
MNNCAICLDELTCPILILHPERPLAQRHSFHEACINLWLETKPSCPTCRAIVVLQPELNYKLNFFLVLLAGSFFLYEIEDLPQIIPLCSNSILQKIHAIASVIFQFFSISHNLNFDSFDRLSCHKKFGVLLFSLVLFGLQFYQFMHSPKSLSRG